MTSAFIIKELRGARALRLNCGRSAFPPFFFFAEAKKKNAPAKRTREAGLHLERSDTRKQFLGKEE